MSNLKLGVEVVSARLGHKGRKTDDGSCNAFVELHFDDQIVKTSIKDNDQNPVWNETFFFNISDPENLSNLVLEANVYLKSADSKSFLGRVRILGTSFVSFSESIVLHYPLEKWSIFSNSAKGELGLMVFVTDHNPSLKPSNPSPAMESSRRRHRVRDPKTEGSAKKRSPVRNSQHQQQQPPVVEASRNQTSNHGQEETRFAGPMPVRSVQINQGLNVQPLDYSIKETSLNLGKGKRASAHDLVEPMEFLFIRVVRARDLPDMDITGGLDPYVEVKVGNFKGKTRHFEKNQNPEWNEVFAFAKSNLQASVLEVVVMDKDVVEDDFIGMVRFVLSEVPKQVESDSPLAPEWYRLAVENGDQTKGEIMLVVWFGTQADEAFPYAIYSDAFHAIDKSSVRSKIYHSPRLWYARVTVIEAQDLVGLNKTRLTNAYVKIQLGNQVVRTRFAQSQNLNPRWNEEFMFVVAEPFEERVIVSVEDHITVNKDESLGRVDIPLDSFDRRADDHPVSSRWFSLEKSGLSALNDKEHPRRVRFAARINLNICLEGGYHVLDESTYHSSDFRPTSKQLWKPSMGILELGIIKIEGINPMKMRDEKGTSDAYCVAKYGHKWVRTRTITDCLNPRFNEQYTWEVYEPATVLTIIVLDNNQINGTKNGGGRGNKDGKMGKIRIRISTLESGRIYSNLYPLLILKPSGVKKMGEIHLAIRFSCTSMFQMVFRYWKPLLPKMHYVRPLTVVQQEILRQQAVNLVAARLSRAEPPLRKEVVEYMLDANSHLWSMRKSRANFSRLKSAYLGLLGTGKWFQDICSWRKTAVTVAVHILYLVFVCSPEMILPVMFLCLFMLGLWNHRHRPRQPLHMDTQLSLVEFVYPDELDEEFDTIPSSRDPEIIRVRYERLRNIASRAQKVVGDMAAQGERLQALLSWRDPRATSIFMAFCLVASVAVYAVPFKVFVLLAGFYVMRHPRFRRQMPSEPINFFRRLPTKTDCML
ncbi:PREDICTED: FT-interacting protein 1 [Tarenaya hassleriana]|uniref:FT-interacting protein 1 n=1 Tax=Tarenaya hassleriana TaxID=28532 RepID=UPI00053C1011|nr:PREDICTED: FT-interacting protein 1 [Tarenaya hassleriana]